MLLRSACTTFAHMDALEFAERIVLNLPYDPNEQQVQLVAALARFCSPVSPSDSIFMLNGYAGTGKTSLTGALVRSLNEVGITSVLLAPTGRAAKVFARFAKHPAYTIHRKIYRQESSGDATSFISSLAENRHHNAVFIVDEASMIGSRSDNGNDLLEDLIQYVYTGDNCRLILLGDTAQLPPVGCQFSPAMTVNVLKTYGLRVTRATLTATARQASDSGILYNATWLRRAMLTDPLPTPQLVATNFADVTPVLSEDLPEVLSSAYSRDGIDETILITRSNLRAVKFNIAIRNTILEKEEYLCKDEYILVAKNNYLWSAKVKGVDFIANGDMAYVTKIYGTETKYGFLFADAKILLPDRDIELEAKLLLTTLDSDAPGLTAEQANRLFHKCINDPNEFAPEVPMSIRIKKLKTNPYYNALQVKYAYAVTCHKAQGGQWKNVFIDMGYIAPEAQGIEFYRWLYTAITRATHHLYIINPSVEVK